MWPFTLTTKFGCPLIASHPLLLSRYFTTFTLSFMVEGGGHNFNLIVSVLPPVTFGSDSYLLSGAGVRRPPRQELIPKVHNNYFGR